MPTPKWFTAKYTRATTAFFHYADHWLENGMTEEQLRDLYRAEVTECAPDVIAAEGQNEDEFVEWALACLDERKKKDV